MAVGQGKRRGRRVRSARMGRLFNDRRPLESIGNIPPAAAELRSYWKLRQWPYESNQTVGSLGAPADLNWQL